MASAENRKIDSELERYQKKIEKTKNLKQMFGEERVVALARKNRSIDERVQQVRSATIDHAEKVLE